MTNRYDDIINIDHKISSARKRMSNDQRAAQFAPFSALSGFGARIIETGRFTDSEIQLDNDAIEEIEHKINYILNCCIEDKNAIVKYFLKDNFKEGGSYEFHEGKIVNYDNISHVVQFEDGFNISIENIIEIDGKIFDIFEN